jgi:hypothetical protein
LAVDGDVTVAHGLLGHEVRGLDGVLESLRGDLVEPRLLGQRLPRSLDVQILVDVVGALDVGERSRWFSLCAAPAVALVFLNDSSVPVSNSRSAWFGVATSGMMIHSFTCGMERVRPSPHERA